MVNFSEIYTIGAYLESTSRQSRSFIIQQSYDDADLRPLSRALNVSDIYWQEQIPTMDMFKDHLEEKGLILHSYGQRKKFHNFLFRHQLLSIDLSESNRTLKDYAMIIQSFSRGKSLDISDSGSLKRFLFGDEKAKEIVQKFKVAVEEMQLTLKEHARNREEINLATAKHKALSGLDELRKTFQEKEEDFVLKRCAYANKIELENRESIKESVYDYMEAYTTLSAIRDIVDQELVFSQDIANELTVNERSAKSEYDRTAYLQQQLKPFLALVKEYNCAAIELHEIYSKYRQDKSDFQIINSVKDVLSASGLKTVLDAYLNIGDLPALLEKIQQDKSEMELLLNQKEQLLDFSTLNNEGSLGYWAIEHYQQYSLELESLLMHYKDYPVTTPGATLDQYIPNPENLLKNDLSFKKDAAGFWVSNGAVEQYIAYQPKQLFASADPQALKKLLESLTKDLHQEISEIKSNIDSLRKLKTFVLSTENFKSYLDVRHRQEELFHFVGVDALEQSQEAFESGIALLKNADQIGLEYAAADVEWNEKRQLLDNYNSVLESLRRTHVSLNNLFSNTTTTEILNVINETFPEFVPDESSQQQQRDYLKSSFEKSRTKDRFIEDIEKEKRNRIQNLDIRLQYREYSASIVEKDTAFKEARFLLQKEPDISHLQELNVGRPDKEEQEYQISKSLYKTRFDDIVLLYASSEDYRFERYQNYDELCAIVLPEAFLDKKIETESSIDAIWSYLLLINDKNKDLNSRKLHKLRDILDEVVDEVSKREDTVRQIHNFLDNGEREITGGHRVSLRTNYLNSYPKAWIDSYSEKLSTDNTLFAEGPSMNELLGDSISLEEKMINAFYAFGGHRSAKPRIETLLDPNFYFDLTFKMESHASGKTNIGSTGQVYAAIALLCIARLSLVNKSTFNKSPLPGIRFMPIDEAEGLGSNFDLLYQIARDFDYQILTMGIKPLGRFKEGEQFIYMLSNNKEATEDVNYQPYGIFCELDQHL